MSFRRNYETADEDDIQLDIGRSCADGEISYVKNVLESMSSERALKQIKHNKCLIFRTAVTYNQVNVIKYFIEKGIKPSDVRGTGGPSNGKDTLNMLCKKGWFEMVQLLIDFCGYNDTHISAQYHSKLTFKH